MMAKWILAMAACALSVAATAAAADPVRVVVDCGVPADYPLSKAKFGVFNSGMVRPDRYARDMHLYDEVRPDSLRVDLGWGAGWIGWKTHPIGGTAADLRYDFTETDRTAALLRDHGVPAYWSYCYTPRPLQPPGGDFKGEPTDLTAWADVLKTMSAHYRAFPGGNPVGYQEVGNEPDNRDFFTGTRDDYLRMYQLGSAAIRAGDPDAVVGGPALAFDSGWVDPYLDRVVRDRSPLDFYSFHYYPGCPYTPPDLNGVVKQMRDALGRRPSLRTAELHLNEFNSYRIDYPRRGRQDRYPIASAFLHDVKYFLGQPGLTRVYWAQFQDSGGGNFSGMIDIDGRRKALFNAYAAYAAMPVDRVALSTGAPAVEGLAAYDPVWARVSVLIWNRSEAAVPVRVSLAHLPQNIDVGACRIDATHASRGDDQATEQLTGTALGQRPPGDRPLTYDADLPPHGVLVLAGARHVWHAVPTSAPVPPGRVVRELHDYPDRASPSYADFDRRTWTARLGLVGDPAGVARVGATVDGWPDAVTVTATGTVAPSAVAGVRVDYQAKDGGYARSVLFQLPGDAAGAKADAPVWGTARPADRVEPLPLDRPTTVAVRHLAPADWTGRVQVSFLLRGDPHGRVKFAVGSGG